MFQQLLGHQTGLKLGAKSLPYQSNLEMPTTLCLGWLPSYPRKKEVMGLMHIITWTWYQTLCCVHPLLWWLYNCIKKEKKIKLLLDMIIACIRTFLFCFFNFFFWFLEVTIVKPLSSINVVSDFEVFDIEILGVSWSA